jgi:3-deoxy-D-manno-octulosonate 8-phosphate phosphatase (KDO 8-P phosphatase)
MGTNMLRFSWFLQHGALPYTAVLSGEHNDTAFYFSKRENFTASFFKVPHKMLALNAICEQQNIQPPEIAYFFDDVLDVPLAEVCGIRILVNQKANPLFIKYCKKNNLVDYLTASPGGQLAVRESAELLMGLYGNFDEVVKGRKDNSEVYREYIQQRKAVSPDFFTAGQNGIEKVVM